MDNSYSSLSVLRKSAIIRVAIILSAQRPRAIGPIEASKIFLRESSLSP